MRRVAALIAFTAVGLLIGCLAAGFVLAFAPVCGDDCETKAFGRFVLVAGSCLIAFPLVGHFLTRGTRLTMRRVATVTIALAVAALGAASSFYVVELRQHHAAAEAARPVVPDLDFMYMSIATRDVPTYAGAADVASKALAVIPQWQRCVIGGAWCDAKPRQVEMRCKIGKVYVNERDWPAFVLIPQENLMGVVPMKSMRLCAPGNIPYE